MLFEIDALWEYQFVANALPPDLSAVDVPDVDWLGPSPAPFGTVGPSFVTNLVAATEWGLGEGLWIRRALVVDGLAPVRLRGQIENSCYVFIDGVYAGAVNRGNGNIVSSPVWEMVIPRSMLSEGTHEIALLCLDEAGGGGDSTFIWVDADYLPAVLALWPSPPLGESIAWLTDVQISENGTEERDRLRNAPRHQFRLSCFVPHAEQPILVNTLYGARAERWLLPLWAQVQHVGAVAAGEFEIDALTSYSEYRQGSFLILWQSARRWQVLGVDDVDTNLLKVTSMTDEFEDAWIAPVRRAYLDGDPQRAFNGRTSRLTATFNIEDNAPLTVAAPAQYLGNDIYFDVGLLEGDATSESIVTEFDLMDEQLGLVAYGTPWLHNRPSRIHRMLAEDAAEAWAIREWLHRRLGRLTPFWHPSFEIDLRVVSTGAITTTLSVASDDYLRYAAARDHIAVETTTGWLARAITDSLVVSEETVQLTLETSLAVDASAILRVCFLGLRRLNSDRAELNWIGGTACSCAVPVLDIEP